MPMLPGIAWVASQKTLDGTPIDCMTATVQLKSSNVTSLMTGTADMSASLAAVISPSRTYGTYGLFPGGLKVAWKKRHKDLRKQASASIFASFIDKLLVPLQKFFF